jgi:hypothetical protein
MYQAHPSHELNCHFSHRPFQGVEPFATRFLFIGLDANYNEDIECSLVFQSVLEYHQDGIAFWQRHNVHHPFLLPQYAGDGRRYHRNFARIGFTRQHASIVSFVELLHVPTVGRNKLEPGDLDSSHLRMINSAVLYGQARHIFVSPGVVRLMQASRAFPWLNGKSAPSTILPVIYRQAD